MRLLSPNLLLILAASATVSSLTGCAAEKKPAWDCQATNVPMGKTIECTSTSEGALTYDGDQSSVGFGTPTTIGTGDGTSGSTTGGSGTATGGTTSDGTTAGGSGTGTGSATGGSGSGSAGGTTSDGDTTYYCAPNSDSPACPPQVAIPFVGSSAGSTSGTSSGGTGTGTGAGSTGGTSDGTQDGTASGGSGSGSGSAGGASGSGSGSASGGGSTGGGTFDGAAPECPYAPDLTYCGGSGGVSSGGSGSGSTDATTVDCTKHNCNPNAGGSNGNGNGSKGGTSDGAGTTTGGTSTGGTTTGGTTTGGTATGGKTTPNKNGSTTTTGCTVTGGTTTGGTTTGGTTTGGTTTTSDGTVITGGTTTGGTTTGGTTTGGTTTGGTTTTTSDGTTTTTGGTTTGGTTTGGTTTGGTTTGGTATGGTGGTATGGTGNGSSTGGGSATNGGGDSTTGGGGSSGGSCVEGSGSSGSGSGVSAAPTCAVPQAEALLCTPAPLGNPAAECGHFGLVAVGKDDNLSGLTFAATQNAALAIVKSGSGGCGGGNSAYRTYNNVVAGAALSTPAGQGISHVTYCACAGATQNPTATTSGGSAGGKSCGAKAGSGGGFQCVEHQGKRTCTEVPECVPGTHASKCGSCIPDGSPDESCVSPLVGGCWITGGGFITDADGKDSFGGNGKPMKDGTIKGQWNHVDHGTGNHAHGDVKYLSCRHIDEPGPGAPKGTMNQAFYGGPARWREAATSTWAEGYWFDVMAKDHGEGKGRVSGGPDYYHFTLRKQADPVKMMSGVIVYETKGAWGSSPGGGNFQIHMPNNGHPYTASAVPGWILPLEN